MSEGSGRAGETAPVPALTVRGLRKSYGATEVLHDLDLVARADGVTALLGPSGCGKTTLLRLVAGFDRPDGGEIRFGEQPVYGPGRCVPAQRRRVGYVPQEGALFPHLTASANAVFGLPRTRRRPSTARELLAGVGLDESLAQRYPHQLSGGQQQRVALARALAPRPALVLLDEPFSSLDAGQRESTRQAVLAILRTAGTSTILVTHDQSEALSMADEVAVMREGTIVQLAAPQQLYRSPVDPGVAAFVGAAVLLPATLDGAVAHSALGPVALDPAAGAAATGSVRLLLRPEQIHIQPDREAGDATAPEGRPGVPARVSGLQFYGHDCAVQLQLLDGGPGISARTLGGSAPRAGDLVHLTVTGTGTVFGAP
ncbi:MAG: ABC transporter ATP-binding protein [Geodermatophilaceae bacterium]